MYIVYLDNRRFLTIAYHFLWHYILGFAYIGWQYKNLAFLLENDSPLICLACHIHKDHEEYIILDKTHRDMFAQNHSTTEYIYAFIETTTIGSDIDITHEMNLFKDTLPALELTAVHIANVIMGFKNLEPTHAKSIKYLMDDDFQEKTII